MQKGTIAISAIVPIFNEEKTLQNVVQTLIDSDVISEVICVNDGSQDASLKILEALREKIEIINLKRNHGKGFAIAVGVKKAKGEIVVFIDADLVGLSREHIVSILEPIRSGGWKAVLGVPIQDESELSHPWIVSLTGERAYFRKDLLPYLDEMKKKRYGIEIFLNSLYKKSETKIVPLRDCISPPKWEKRDALQAIKEYFLEIKEVAEEFGRTKGLLPEDNKIFSKFSKSVTLQELKEGIWQIKDKKMRNILEKYLLQYLNVAKKKVKNFLYEGR
jgi:glycosyltransferase involved in cell wall biosynthesis